MKLIIESSGIGNCLPSIRIVLSRYDLAKLVQDNKLYQSGKIEGKEETEYYQETSIEVK